MPLPTGAALQSRASQFARAELRLAVTRLCLHITGSLTRRRVDCTATSVRKASCRLACTSVLPGDLLPAVDEQHTWHEQVSGCIHLIVGPMFSGKTSELLLRVRALEATGKKVALIKSDKDSRYSKSTVITHDGDSKACYALSTLSDFKHAAGEGWDDYEVFAIDEAQFFPDLLVFCLQAADHHHKHIVLAGLDGDFRRHRFGQVLDMVPLADSVTKLSAKCAYCGSPAHFSLRIAADDRQEVVGGADKYAPVCRHHFVNLSTVRQTGPPQ